MKLLKDELLFKKDMIKVLKSIGVFATIKEIQIIGFHYNKFNYNFLYNNKKYVYKKNLKKNNINDLMFIYRHYDDIYKHFSKNFKKYNIKNKEDLLVYNEKQSQNLIDFLESDKYLDCLHLPKRLDMNSEFIIYEFYNFNFYTDDDFLCRQEDFKILWENKIVPICLGRGNVGYLNNNKKDFIMYDIDLLCINTVLTRIYIHNDMDDDDCWLSDIEYKRIQNA